MEEKIEDIFKEIILRNFQKNYVKLKEIGLYPGQEMILEYLVNHEGVTQSELVSFTKRSAATIAKMVQRMQEKGYLTRLIEPSDKRMHHLYVTQKGKETYAKIVALQKQNDKEYATLFSEKEKEQIKTFLVRIRDYLKGENNEKNN